MLGPSRVWEEVSSHSQLRTARSRPSTDHGTAVYRPMTLQPPPAGPGSGCSTDS